VVKQVSLIDNFYTQQIVERVNLYNATITNLSPTCSTSELELIDRMLWKGVFETCKADFHLTEEELRGIILNNDLDRREGSRFKQLKNLFFNSERPITILQSSTGRMYQEKSNIEEVK
jgi:hypothetical protein